MNRKTIFSTLFVILVLSVAPAAAQTTSFTHQGALKRQNNNYDFEFKLFDTPTVGTGIQQGATQQQLNVPVMNNAFTVQLDFGAAVFTGGELYLETAWRAAGGGTFTVLSPRERITAVYANRSLSAATADTATNATQLGGLPASGFIQNSIVQQAVTNFNISGTGAADTFNAASQYNLGGFRILSSSQGFHNLFAGLGAGSANTTGDENAFFGYQAGYLNTTGSFNSFFGHGAGTWNTAGSNNAFFGVGAGFVNNLGNANAFFGNNAGGSNTTGNNNTFYGVATGYANTTGSNNAFYGQGAGFQNTTGNENLFLGTVAGSANVSGNRNTVVGVGADMSAGNLTNATAIGYRAIVGQSNALVLGSINGVNFATADTHVGIGTITPASKLHVSGSGIIRARVNSDSNAGLALTLNEQPKWSVATVTGGQFQIFNDANGLNALWIDSGTNNVGIGTTAPADKLHVSGTLRLDSLGSGGITQLCLNPSNQISTCSSSLRYKNNIATWHTGLSLITRLRPVTFDWKQGGEHDLGLVAEEVANVEPLLVTHNDKGEVEGVKYDRVGVLLINAVNEQQSQIASQQTQIESQRRTIEQQQQQLNQQQQDLSALKQLVCSARPKAKVCK